MSAKEIVQDICSEVGVALNGERSWDMRIHNERAYDRIVAEGSLGLGESYMDGWWDCPDLVGFFKRLLKSSKIKAYRHAGLRTSLAFVKAKLTNVQTPRQARNMADAHYNLSNEMFEEMLGPSMAYTCGYWAKADNLDDAQYAKYDLICRKLDLKPGERVLDIGCGWGGLAKYMAEHYDVYVVGLTVAKEQADYAERFCNNDNVEFVLCDYREFSAEAHGGPFDKIVSVGMVEHVGYRNYRALFETAEQSMRDQGLFLLHTIGNNITTASADAWISRYIFPGGVIPSMRQLSESSESLLPLHDLHNIGVHYTPTLLAWADNFDSYWRRSGNAEGRPRIWGSEETFRRMWDYYLRICAANFAVGDIHVWQLIYAKGHLPNGYESKR